MHCIRCALIMVLLTTGAAYGQDIVAAPTTKLRTITVKDTAELEAYKSITDADAEAYDSKTKELSFTVNETDTKACWKLVHDGKAVRMLDYNAGKTSSRYTIETFGTLKEATDRIDELKLTIDDMTLEGAEHEAEKTGTAGNTEPVVTEPVKTK